MCFHASSFVCMPSLHSCGSLLVLHKGHKKISTKQKNVLLVCCLLDLRKGWFARAMALLLKDNEVYSIMVNLGQPAPYLLVETMTGKGVIKCFKCWELEKIVFGLQKRSSWHGWEHSSWWGWECIDGDVGDLDCDRELDDDSEVIYDDVGWLFLIRKTLSTSKVPKKGNWLCTDIFWKTCTVRNHNS